MTESKPFVDYVQGVVLKGIRKGSHKSVIISGDVAVDSLLRRLRGLGELDDYAICSVDSKKISSELMDGVYHLDSASLYAQFKRRSRGYHPDSDVNSEIIGIVEDVRRNRKGYVIEGQVVNGPPLPPEHVAPVGRIDISGKIFREEVIGALNDSREDLGIVSIEEIGPQVVVMFSSGIRSYDIFLDTLFSRFKIPQAS